TETTEAGNARLLKVTQDMSAEVLQALAKIKTDLPEKATEIARRTDEFTKAFAACAPVVKFASTTSTHEENARAAERMRAECNDQLAHAVLSQIELALDTDEFAKAKA